MVIVLIVVLFRFFNIYTSLQTSILSYRSIEIQPIKTNGNLSNTVVKISEKATSDLPNGFLSNLPSEFSTEPPNDSSDRSRISLEEESNSIYDPITEMSITVEEFNLYDLDELMHFKGIGEKTAQAIIEYREQYGGFTDFKALLLVKGIGEKKLEQLLNGK